MASSVFASLDPEAARKMCVKMQVPYGGAVDLDPLLLRACEEGLSVKEDSGASNQIRSALDCCLQALDGSGDKHE